VPKLSFLRLHLANITLSANFIESKDLLANFYGNGGKKFYDTGLW